MTGRLYERFSQSGERLPAVATLTPSEAAIVNAIALRGIAPRRYLMLVLYGPQDIIDPKILDVYICKARKKLIPFNIHIKTIWGQGHQMDEESCERWRALIAAEPQPFLTTEALTSEIRLAFRKAHYETIGLNELAEATAVHLRERGIA